MNQEYIEKDNVLIRAGDKIDRIYFLLSGEVQIFTEIKGREVLFDKLYQGSSIGVYGILGKLNSNYSNLVYLTLNMIYRLFELSKHASNPYLHNSNLNQRKLPLYHQRKSQNLAKHAYWLG